jgi:glycosyltransferase involved in cell wall biosynthesis
MGPRTAVPGAREDRGIQGSSYGWEPILANAAMYVARLNQPAPALVSVVIPTMNEAANLQHVMPRLPRDHEVIVVDGGSTDGTVDVAISLRPDAVVLRQPGRGKGNALLAGFQAASGEIIVTLDADGSAKPEEIPRFVRALADGADFAKGSRFVSGGGSADLTWLRKLGNRFLCGMVNLLYGTLYTDLCYGYNAFWRRCVPCMPRGVAGFEIETMMNIRAARTKLRVVEVPSYEESRRFGESNLRTFRDGFRILRVILRERFRSRRKLAPAPEPDHVPAALEWGWPSPVVGAPAAEPAGVATGE